MDREDGGGLLCKENYVPCKETPPLSSIKVKCPRYIFSHIFCGLLVFILDETLCKYRQHCISNKPLPFLLRFFLTQRKISFCQCPHISRFSRFYFKFCIEIFGSIRTNLYARRRMCANFLCLTATHCNLFCIILYPITTIISSQSNHLQFLS